MPLKEAVLRKSLETIDCASIAGRLLQQARDRASITGSLTQEQQDLKDPGRFESPCFSGKQTRVL